MLSQKLEVAVSLANEKVRFTGRGRDNPPVAFDYAPPLGDGRGYTGLEMLLLSLAACSGTSVVALLRQMRKSVRGLVVSAEGVRRATHPTALETIALHFQLTSEDATDHDVEMAVDLSRESICPVWAMVKGNVKISADWSIVAP